MIEKGKKKKKKKKSFFFFFFFLKAIKFTESAAFCRVGRVTGNNNKFLLGLILCLIFIKFSLFCLYFIPLFIKIDFKLAWIFLLSLYLCIPVELWATEVLIHLKREEDVQMIDPGVSVEQDAILSEVKGQGVGSFLGGKREIFLWNNSTKWLQNILRNYAKCRDHIHTIWNYAMTLTVWGQGSKTQTQTKDKQIDIQTNETKKHNAPLLEALSQPQLVLPR